MSRRFFLTKSDREHIIYLHAAETVLKRFGNEWDEHKRPADVAAKVQAFFSDHAAEHIERMQSLDQENSWKVIGACS
ncbi:hypothetical protein [Paenibacillus methanolicus]|uniref:Uncharacterized protein n=1 Tax=Paenibacillus methanolicus TaxID=582686 RepID=A0A5S5BK10_9BACL|nr:hypothetical protein [Paenibacillus methanolicus]TYP67407.1 hypothetical protein BCM02_12425 [Paenibacillus methanolicus]